jgi:hydroxymethylbilane synthase
VTGVLRIGTRGSKLAVAQTRQAADRIAELSGRDVEIVTVTTHGDVNRASLKELGGRGVFATELRDVLREGEVDIAVHSLKDLPTAGAPGLVLAAHPTREDARDALVARDGLTLAELPAGARVGTGSPRRVAQLRRVRGDLDIRDIRGNIDTRIGFVTSGELDAVVLATAGLSRYERTGYITERFDLAEFPNSPGQGALAIEVREGFELDALSELDDPATRLAVEAERAVLAGLDAGCQAPVGAHAEVVDGVLRLHAVVYDDRDPVNVRVMEASGEAPAPATRLPLGPAEARPVATGAGAELAARLVDDLFAAGAGALTL